MTIAFERSRWDQIAGDYARWWNGELKRPLINACGPRRDPGRSEPDLPAYGFQAQYPLSVSAERIVDRADYDLSCGTWVADGFPSFWVNFGPGVLAALVGGELEAAASTVWFHPPRGAEDRPIREISLAPPEADNVWFRRIGDIYRSGIERWQGRVQMSMTDLGGNLDIVSTFRPGERLLYDLYDAPGEVKRLTWEAHNAWWRAFGAYNAALRPVNPGYTAWTPIFSAAPYYMLQCDFAYMLGPDMFDEFVRPEIVASCRKLANAFYHLDGTGQLPHLDSLLRIEELKGVQWVPGEGNKPVTEWPAVYRKIHAAGKRIQLFGDLNTLDTVASQIGTAEGIILIAGETRADDAERLLRKWS
ncbi:MAG: hypothetical protein FJ225_02990 [Lentisphaerae bacterium]|nr:hypothetical protein [Lentisphaerota bacterium]